MTGSWESKLEVRDGLLGIVVRAADGSVICEAYPKPYLVQVNEANGVLLASAPDLLGMLRLVVKYLDHPDVQAIPFAAPAESVAARCHALIAKAGGVS